MKKTGKVIAVLLQVLVLAFTVAACGGNAPVNPDNPPPEGVAGPNAPTTIHDAYEQNRPNYDEKFDYESGYVPIEPPPLDMDVTVRLAENSPFKFADGTSELKTKGGTPLTSEDFDLSQIDENREVLGFVMTDKDGKESLVNFENFSVPYIETVTLSPYFDTEKGYTSVSIGSGKNGYFNYDYVPGSISANKTISMNPTAVVAGGVGGYSELGVVMTEPSAITYGSALRLDSKFSVADGVVYEVVYNYENKGTSDIHLQGYQISSSTEYRGQTAYESRFRQDIDLAPGESTRVVGQYKLGKNGNLLTYIVASDDMENGMVLGMSMAIKATELEEPETVSPPKPVAKASVTLKLPTGFTVSDDFVKEGVVGENLPLPSQEQITNNTGKELEGWYTTAADGSISFVTASTKLSRKGATVSPHFKRGDDAQALVAGAARNLPDYYGNLSDMDLDYTADAEKMAWFTAADSVIDGVRARTYSHSATLEKDDYFRLLTTCGTSGGQTGITAGHTYDFIFDFTNLGTTSLSFKVAQIQGTIKLDESEGAVYSDTVTLAAGESKKVVVTIKLQNNNANAMTVFVMQQAAENMKLGIVMGKVNKGIVVDPNVKYNLTLAGDADVSFAGGVKTIETSAGVKVSDLINNNTGRTIAGWYDDNNTYAKDFVMPEKALTITPYFEAADGFSRLWAMSGKASGLPNNISGFGGGTWSVTASGSAGYGSTLESAKTVVKGENGLNEMGVLLQYKGDAVSAAAGSGFRFDTALGTAGAGGAPGKLPDAGGTHTFIMNFENRGTTAIKLNGWIVNSGTDKTSCTNNAFTLDLQPGEFTTVTISPTYTKGNGNQLTYFELAEALNANLALAVSLSVRYNYTPAA